MTPEGEGAARAFRSPSPEATEALAAELGRRLETGTVIALEGELGAGKTTFVRGLARGLEVEARVSSPTFALMHEYPGRLPLYHFDAWMEGREKAYLAEGGEAWLGGRGVAVVEWAERVAEALPRPRLRVRLAHLGPEERGIRISVVGIERGAKGLQALLTALEPGACRSEPDFGGPGGEPPPPGGVERDS